MDRGAADQTFSALADPTRRSILRILSKGEHSVSALAEEFSGMGRTAVSAHLRVLRQARLVTERRQGKYRLYSLRHAPVSEVVSFLREVYQQGLDELAIAASEDRSMERPARSGGWSTVASGGVDREGTAAWET